MTAKMNVALSHMRRAQSERRPQDVNPDGLLTTESSFYDGEIHTAYIHWRTARALHRAGLIRYGGSDPEWGTELWLPDSFIPPPATAHSRVPKEVQELL